MYRKLNEAKSEIRILEIIPSLLNQDMVQCNLKHVSLDEENFSEGYKKFKSRSTNSGTEEWKDKFVHNVDERDKLVEDNILINYWEKDSRKDFIKGGRYTWGDYQALSYEWGDPTPNRTIKLDGIVAHVPENVEAALRFLRDLPETKDGMQYWVDALCIDQENTQEKNHQVRLMKHIYNSARAVLAWLGPSDIWDGEAIGLMHDLIRTTVPDGPLQFLSNYSPKTLRAVCAFFRKTYWKRLWIIQELALNHKSTLIVCGSYFLTRRMVRVVSVFWRENYEDIHHIIMQNSDDYILETASNECWESITRVNRLLSLQPESCEKDDLSCVLHLSHISESSDPRDKVYGLLGLLGADLSSKMEPNYDGTVKDAYINFTKSIIVQKKDLGISFCWMELPSSLDWPSWVPDWRLPFTRNHIQYLTRCNASRDSPAKIRFQNGCELICMGFEIDRVDGLSSASLLHRSEAIEIVQPRCRLYRYSSEFEAWKAVIRSLFMNHPNVLTIGSGYRLYSLVNSYQISSPELTHDERLYSFQKENEDFFVFGRKFSTFFPVSLEIEDVAQSVANIRTTSVSLIGRRLMTSETGFVGLVPAATKPDDVIAVIMGCPFPIIVRPVGRGWYRIIGECYIDGLMNGEVFEFERKGEFLRKEMIFV